VIVPIRSTARFELAALAHTWCRALVRDFDTSCHWEVGTKVDDKIGCMSRAQTLRGDVLGATNS